MLYRGQSSLCQAELVNKYTFTISNFIVWQKVDYMYQLNPLYSGNPKRIHFANSEDPDEMQQNAAFHYGLHRLQR